MTVAAMEALDWLEGLFLVLRDLKLGDRELSPTALEKIDTIRAALPAKSAASDLESRARLFATAAHAAIGQKRKYTGENYVNHPAAVAEIVRSVPHTESMLAAAWLHDVVEDTAVTIDELRREFGPVVAMLVSDLTDVSCPADGNRAARKAIDRPHTANAIPPSQTIKLADLIDNTRSIVQYDPDFAKVYLAEKALLLEVLREGDPTLWAQADELVNLGMLGITD
jgi:(p)ppGpp synthase/HD superfamily hydrolase